ncbi:ubiquitin-associated protein 1 [Euwallacea similis]|uniref:ubiquitin-associated protein 1 n=1 Tax=Euwallacea similis TaxID=1736056 RepID=UPI00344D88F8
MSNSYVDDIKVKISEKYKPPCRISQPMSYSQHLTLSKQLQDNLPTYEFHLEKMILGTVRVSASYKDVLEERKRRLSLAREEFNKKLEQEKSEKLEKEQAEKELLEKTNRESPAKIELESQNSFIDPTFSYGGTYPSNQNKSSQNSNYITKNGILMPIPISNNHSSYAKTFLNSANTFPSENVTKSITKEFNLSDFESDTSSPFDNMELKTLNDFEELQKVLKSNSESNNLFAGNSYPFQTNATQVLPKYQSANIAYPPNPTSYAPPHTSLSYNKLANTFSQANASFNSSTYSQYVPSQVPTPSNGYLYSVQPQVTSQAQYPVNTPRYMVQSYAQKPQCKSVPDLVKSLETELDNSHLNDVAENSRHSASSSFYTTTNVPVPARPKSTESVFPKAKVKDGTSKLLDNLTEGQQAICREISAMGFPLDRVVRVCGTVGFDQKKVLDHLLALAQLLDLGFSENLASEALLRNDNDRDKALDLLIS